MFDVCLIKYAPYIMSGASCDHFGTRNIKYILFKLLCAFTSTYILFPVVNQLPANVHNKPCPVKKANTYVRWINK